MSKTGYSELSDHYKDMLELFDTVHFGSGVVEELYRSHVNIDHSQRIAISNKNVGDSRRARSYDSKQLKLLFVGNTATYKGFPMLEQLLMELYGAGCRDWSLEVWGCVGSSTCELIHYNGYYKSEDLEQIYSEDCLLVTPSLWHETFSLVTLEALSYGIPALVSSTVGAREIIEGYDPWFVFGTSSELKSKLIELVDNHSRLRDFNRLILEREWVYSFDAHVKDIMKLY